MGLLMTAWLGYKMYCLSCEARNTSCTCLSYIGRPGRQAMQFGLSINWHDLKDLDRNFACSSTSLHPWLMKLLKNLVIYMKVQESLSIGYFQESSDMRHLIKCWRRSSWPIRWFVVNVCRHFVLMFNKGFSASAITIFTAVSSIISSNANVSRRSWSNIGSNLEELIHWYFQMLAHLFQDDKNCESSI